MDRIRITGGAPLHGAIPISGAKNAALPLMIASLLTDETLELTNVPRLADIASLLRILGNHGVDHAIAGKRAGQATEAGQTLRLTARAIVDTCAPYELVSHHACELLGRSRRCWPGSARRGYRSRAAARSARGRSTC